MNNSRTSERAGPLYKQNLRTGNGDWPEGGEGNGTGRATTFTWTKQTSKQTETLITTMYLQRHKINAINAKKIMRVGTRRRGGKGKAIPLQACTGSEGSGWLRLPDFKTISTRRWQVRPYAPAAFTPQEIFLVLISVVGRRAQSV